MAVLAIYLVLSATLLALSAVLVAAPNATDTEDPCAKIVGMLPYVPPADALACLKVFPFSEARRQNILSVASGVLDFYTFEDYYLKSPPPFQDSTVDIRQELARINTTVYVTDYDFNRDLYYFTQQLNDGHTRWIPWCYVTFQNLIPAPVVTIEEDGVQNVYIAPDSVSLISAMGSQYTSYFDSLGFDWKRLAGARVLEIEGQDAYAYADMIADTESGNFLDHGVRVNSGFTSYRLNFGAWVTRFGDIANRVFPDLESITMKLITVNSTEPETVTIPFLSVYSGFSFQDQGLYWVNNCAARTGTNGPAIITESLDRPKLQPKANLADAAFQTVAPLPTELQPTLVPIIINSGILSSYMLSDGKTGVIVVGSFEGDLSGGVFASLDAFKAAGATRLIVDITNNPGGFVCQGQFLHAALAGTNSLGDFPNPGYQSAIRANPLAKKIVEAHSMNIGFSFFSPFQWAFLNNTPQPSSYNYLEPSTSQIINGEVYEESQRILDTCFIPNAPEEPLFAPENIAIVGNGNCASTCAMFTTLMKERHNIMIAVFGGKPGLDMQFKGMAGNQVLEWTDLNSAITSAGLKDDPLAPPDLIVNGNFRHNWRTAYSFLDESQPIEYFSELPHLRFPYTADSYINPQKIWEFAAQEIFH